MTHANHPLSFAGDALLMTAYILNHVPSKSVSATLCELWYSRKPSLDHYPWGSVGYVHYKPINMENSVLELLRWCSLGTPNIPNVM